MKSSFLKILSPKNQNPKSFPFRFFPARWASLTCLGRCARRRGQRPDAGSARGFAPGTRPVDYSGPLVPGVPHFSRCLGGNAKDAPQLLTGKDSDVLVNV